ncbi:hypothetical protein C2S51_011976 [Perilla frutescens var. frutescens]|nr:hypothetical protein C2S51_011976 [Perilla frutescens var. frutescens]
MEEFPAMWEMSPDAALATISSAAAVRWSRVQHRQVPWLFFHDDGADDESSTEQWWCFILLLSRDGK